MEEVRTKAVREILEKAKIGVYQEMEFFDSKRGKLYTEWCLVNDYFKTSEVRQGIVGYYATKNDEKIDVFQTLLATAFFDVKNPIISKKAEGLLQEINEGGYCVNLEEKAICFRIDLELKKVKVISVDFPIRERIEAIRIDDLIQNRERIVDEIVSKAQTKEMEVYLPKNVYGYIHFKNMFDTLVEIMRIDNNSNQ